LLADAMKANREELPMICPHCSKSFDHRADLIDEIERLRGGGVGDLVERSAVESAAANTAHASNYLSNPEQFRMGYRRGAEAVAGRVRALPGAGR